MIRATTRPAFVCVLLFYVATSSQSRAESFLDDGHMGEICVEEHYPPLADLGEICVEDHYPALADLGTDFGVAQDIVDHELAYDVLALIYETEEYIDEEIRDEYDDELPEDCWNEEPECSYWAAIGKCSDKEHEPWMSLHCAPACQACNKGMNFGVVQDVVDDEMAYDVLALIYETEDYIEEEVRGEEDDELPEDCWNEVPECSYWAAIGRCSDKEHEPWMSFHCAPACQTCASLEKSPSYEKGGRCAMDPSLKDHMGPGDLHRMFERVVNDESLKTKYNMTVLSRPSSLDGAKEQDDAPYLLMFENFLSPQECDDIINLAGDWEGTSEKYDGEDGEKTDTERFHCGGECNETPIMGSVVNRLSSLFEIPETNIDGMQILRYGPQKQLSIHSDFNTDDEKMLHGTRLVTVNLYLGDVKEGGGTNFPKLNNLTVSPKKGRMVVWPNVLNEDPDAVDRRTVHRSLAVVEGTKYGGNICLYNRDFWRGEYDEVCNP